METWAAILAGGRSARMGRDKAALVLEGRPLLDRLESRFRRCFDRVAVVGREAMPDLRPGQGPLAGLETALACTGAGSLFLTALDLPFADPELARLLLDRLGRADACLIRRADGQLEPLFAAYARSCLPAVRACLDEGRRSMAALLDRLDCRVVAEADLPGFPLERALFNLNTPEDLRRAEFFINSSLQ